jgi:hypothetical protein
MYEIRQVLDIFSPIKKHLPIRSPCLSQGKPNQKLFSFNFPALFSRACVLQGCQILLGTTYQNGKKFQIPPKFTKWPLNIEKWT